jgi:hypothetical protein
MTRSDSRYQVLPRPPAAPAAPADVKDVPKPKLHPLPLSPIPYRLHPKPLYATPADAKNGDELIDDCFR